MCRVRDTRLSHRRLHRKKSPEKGMPKKNARAPAEWQDARAVPPRTVEKVAGDLMRASMNSKFLFPLEPAGRLSRPLPIWHGWSRALHPPDPEV
jgi:hypothetical protein